MYLVPKRYDFESMLDTFFDDSRNSKCDIYEKDGKYHLELDVPGFKKEDINVEFKDGYLSITASSKIENEQKDKNYIRRERKESSMSRQFYLGNVDTETIDAKIVDGVLKISLDKKDISNKKIIEVK